MIKPVRSHSYALGNLLRVLLLPAFALAILGALLSAVMYQIEVERHAAHNEAVAHSQSLARTLAEHVSHILRQTDHATQLFKLKFEETGGALRIPEFTRHNGLMGSVLPSRLDLPVALIDRSGKVIDSAHAFLPASVADQPYFQTLASGSVDAPMFSTPVVEPSTRKWHIQVARRLNDRTGQFAGLIIIRIDPAYFVDDYDRLNVDDAGAMVLMSRDGGLSVGRSGEQLFISDSIDFAPVRDGGHNADELVANKALDNVDRIYSYRDMPRYALSAVVGVPRQQAMERFERHRLLYLRIAAAAAALILGVVALLMQQSARLRASMRAAQEAQATLRAAADGSLDTFVVLKAWPAKGRFEDFVIADINERGATMVGMAREDLLGARLQTTLPDLHRNGFVQRYRDAMRKRQPLDEEVELAIDNQPVRWLHHQIVPIPGGVAITARDITARKHSEFELHDNRSFLQSLIDHLPLLIYVKGARADDSGKMLVWNNAAEQITGVAADAVLGRNASVALPDGLSLVNNEQEMTRLSQSQVIDRPEQRIERADGSERYLHAMSVPLFDDDGQLEYILCIAEDVTGRREQEQALRANRAELAAVNDASPLGLMRANADGQCTYVNLAMEAITGLPRARALGEGWLSAIHPDDRAVMQRARSHFLTSNDPFKAIVRCQHLQGHLVWTSIKIAAIRIDGGIEGYVGSIDDITSLREAEMALRESESRLRTIADTVPAMIAYIDAEQIYRFHNVAYEREFGRNGQQVHGHTVRDTVGEVRYASLEPHIRRVLAGETVTFDEIDHPDGVERNLEVSYIPQFGHDGKVAGFHVIRQDVTSQQREKKQLLRLAQIDALTGLTNRAGFMQKLSDAMHASHQNGTLMAVMYMDIDHFKPVNDTYGHNVGDALLKAFSGRLTHALRASDTVARLGGDEFTIIMEKLARPEDAAVIAAKIVAVMETPFHLDGLSVSVSASIGVAYYRDGALTPESLLKQADVMLYQAKQAGRNTYRAAA